MRRIPAQFSWVDQRLVGEGHVQRCDCQALALYLVLVTVADAQGLSFYGDAALARLLSLEPARVRQGRADLIAAGLIAYAPPLYQVLSLDGATAELSRDEQCARLAQLRALLERPKP